MTDRTGTPTIRAVIADDQPVVRRAMRAYLEHDGIAVVGEATSGPDAVTLARSRAADVVLMDVRMPGGDGISATAALAAPETGGPRIPVVVVTTFDLDDYLFGALEAGASGFLLKDAEPAEVVTAVRAAATGDALVSPRVTRRLIAEFARRGPHRAPGRIESAPLTEREREVLAGIAEGLSNAELAERFVIEIGTVKTHVSAIIRKLGVRDRVQAVIWAHRNAPAAIRPGGAERGDAS